MKKTTFNDETLFVKKNPAMAIIGKKQEVAKKNLFDQESEE